MPYAPNVGTAVSPVLAPYPPSVCLAMPVEFWLVVPVCASTAPMTMELTAYVWPVTTAAKIVRVRLHFHVEPADQPNKEPS